MRGREYRIFLSNLRAWHSKGGGGCRPLVTPSPTYSTFNFVQITNSLVFAAGATLTGLSSLALSTFVAATANISNLTSDIVSASTAYFGGITTGSAVVSGSVELSQLRVSNPFNNYNGPVASVLNCSRPYSGNVYQIGSSQTAAGYLDGNLYANPEPMGMILTYTSNVSLNVGTRVMLSTSFGFVYQENFGRLGIGTFTNGVFTPAHAGMYYFLPVFVVTNPSGTTIEVSYVSSYLGSVRYVGSLPRAPNNSYYSYFQTPFTTYLRPSDTLNINMLVQLADANFVWSPSFSRLEIWRV